MTKFAKPTLALKAGLSALAILAVVGASAITVVTVASPVWADDHSDSDAGHSGGQGGKGGSGGHDDGHDTDDHADGHTGGPKKGGGHDGDDGHDDDGHDDGGHDSGGGSKGAGKGPGPLGQGEGEGKGASAGRGGESGGKPVWAQEGIPEVELGRLNVARAPDQVLDRAYAEALAGFTSNVAAFYKLDLEAMERELRDNWDAVEFIDSPLQNLALFKDALNGTSVLKDVGIDTDNDTLLAAFLGTASDKSIPISRETALAITAILGKPMTEAEAAALAERAERIRKAILAGHG